MYDDCMTFNPEELERKLAAMFQDPDYRPLNQHRLCEYLGISQRDRRRLRRLLRSMEQRGRAVRLRKNRWGPPAAQNLDEGLLRVNPRGFAFLYNTESGREYFVPHVRRTPALNGDRVQVSVSRRDGGTGKDLPRARVVRVLQRGRKEVVGRLLGTRYHLYVEPDDPRLLPHIHVEEDGGITPRPPVGNRVVIELAPCTETDRVPRGHIVEDLGAMDDDESEMPALLRRYGLSPEFPPDAQDEADAATVQAGIDDRQRTDLREIKTVTIDPSDARDFDDAVSARPLPGGGWELHVHIADVAEHVPLNGAVDREASDRGTTVYLVDRSIPMLPRSLTEDVCSLQPGSDRLTQTVSMIIDAEGRLQKWSYRPTVIRSDCRLDYRSVQERFDHGTPPPGADEETLQLLRTLRTLAATLRKNRMTEGGLDFNLPEISCELDDQGRAVAFRRRGEDEAYQLIEECMLAANRAMATELVNRQWPGLFRVHEEPEPEQWDKMARELAALGIAANPANTIDLRRVARHAGDSDVKHAAMVTMLRNMKRAFYTSLPAAHFGLAFPIYLHFTSPIRRYPDLVVHRVLKAAAAGEPPPYSRQRLQELGEHCSRREREADEAEKESLDIKRIGYYHRRLQRGETGPHDGVVVAIVGRGLLVELPETLQRGLLPFALLDDYYEVTADQTAAVARRSNRSFRIGQKLSVEVIRVDRRRRQVDFRLFGTRTGKSLK